MRRRSLLASDFCDGFTVMSQNGTLSAKPSFFYARLKGTKVSRSMLGPILGPLLLDFSLRAHSLWVQGKLIMKCAVPFILKYEKLF
jgi:hypothetical protein